MPRRRDRAPWWAGWAAADDRAHRLKMPNQRHSSEQPLHFPQRMELAALGVVRPANGQIPPGAREHSAALAACGDISVDFNGLAAWKRPAGATEGFVLEVEDRPSAPITVSTTGTRIDSVSALWLWVERWKVEQSHCVVTASSWCVSCGRAFEDRRWREGRLARIAARCPACRNRRTRHLPPRRRCRAADCKRYFVPVRENHYYCSNACKSAQHTAASRT